MTALPSYENLKCDFPLSESQKLFIEQSRNTVRHILEGTDPRLLLIIGPCSIHDQKSALDYAQRLQSIQKEVSHQFFIIMRVYCEKARSSQGWKGFLYDPHLDGSDQIDVGLQWTRQLLLDLIDLGIPAGTEFLDPITAFYYDDLITWGSIGARTSASQPHRQFASSLEVPIGFKNDVNGNISVAVQGASVASQPQTCILLGNLGKPTLKRTCGNPFSHIVLRGGERQPNFDALSIQEALDQLKENNLSPSVLIDCSHQNSRKIALRQMDVFQSVLNQFKTGNRLIRGVMIESFLNAGSQVHAERSSLHYGISITDPCLEWTETQKLIKWGVEYLSHNEQDAQDGALASDSLFEWAPNEVLLPT